MDANEREGVDIGPLDLLDQSHTAPLRSYWSNRTVELLTAFAAEASA